MYTALIYNILCLKAQPINLQTQQGFPIIKNEIYLLIWEPSYYNVQLLYFDGTPPASSLDNHPNLLLRHT